MQCESCFTRDTISESPRATSRSKCDWITITLYNLYCMLNTLWGQIRKPKMYTVPGHNLPMSGVEDSRDSWIAVITEKEKEPQVHKSWFPVCSMQNPYLVHTRQQPQLFLCVLLQAPSVLISTGIHHSAQNHNSVWDGSQQCNRSPL